MSGGIGEDIDKGIDKFEKNMMKFITHMKTTKRFILNSMKLILTQKSVRLNLNFQKV